MEGFGGFEFSGVSLSAASDGKAATATEAVSDGEAAEDAAASSEELPVVTSIVLQPCMSGRLCESSSRLRESIGRYNAACANVDVSPKPGAMISQRRPCPKDSNETQIFSADVDYDELVTSMRVVVVVVFLVAARVI